MIFDDLPEDEQENIFQKIQNYLDNYSQSANSLDTKMEIHDNIEAGV